MLKQAVVEKEGDYWVLKTKDGTRILGKHKKAQDAYKQEYAIQKSQENKMNKSAFIKAALDASFLDPKVLANIQAGNPPKPVSGPAPTFGGYLKDLGQGAKRGMTKAVDAYVQSPLAQAQPSSTLYGRVPQPQAFLPKRTPVAAPPKAKPAVASPAPKAQPVKQTKPAKPAQRPVPKKDITAGAPKAKPVQAQPKRIGMANGNGMGIHTTPGIPKGPAQPMKKSLRSGKGFGK